MGLLRGSCELAFPRLLPSKVSVLSSKVPPASRFPLGFHGREEFIKTTHDGAFDLKQLFDTLGIPSVMGEIVVLGFHAIDLWHAMVVLNDNANLTRGIGLYN